MVYERILPWYVGTSEAWSHIFALQHIIRTADMKFETTELGQKISLTRMSVRKTLSAENMQAVIIVVEYIKGIPTWKSPLFFYLFINI